MTIADEFHFLFADEFRFLFVNMCWVSSFSSMISKSHFSFYLLSFLSLSPFQAHKYLDFAIFMFDFSLFLHFKLYLWLIFPSLFVLFPLNRSPDESNLPN